jgi:transposase
MYELIPEDNILKLVNKFIDFSFIRKKTKHLYSNKGRPSIDPELLLKMLLIGYLEGITSERKLC